MSTAQLRPKLTTNEMEALRAAAELLLAGEIDEDIINQDDLERANAKLRVLLGLGKVQRAEDAARKLAELRAAVFTFINGTNTGVRLPTATAALAIAYERTG